MAAKLLVILAAVLMMLSFSMAGFAQTQNTTGTQMGTQTQVMPEKKTEQKVTSYRGEVASIDETTHMLVVKGKEGDKTFDVSQATVKGKIEPDHYVSVKYTETNGKMVASSVTVSHKVSSSTKTLHEKHTS